MIRSISFNKPSVFLFFTTVLLCCSCTMMFGQGGIISAPIVSDMGNVRPTKYAAALVAPSMPDYSSELKVGYGVLSGAEIGFSLASAIGTGLGASLGLAIGDEVSILISGVPTNVTITRIENDDTYYGTAMVGYNFFPARWVSLGFQANYTPVVGSSTVDYSNGTSNSFRESYGIFQLYGRLDFHYVSRPRFQMYSGIMGGYLFIPQSGDSGWVPHLNLLGFRFGGENAFYTELGLGLSSTLSVGYSRKF